jgi:hypothetical protein
VNSTSGGSIDGPRSRACIARAQLDVGAAAAVPDRASLPASTLSADVRPEKPAQSTIEDSAAQLTPEDPPST